mgnify:CR=1 FL=1
MAKVLFMSVIIFILQSLLSTAMLFAEEKIKFVIGTDDTPGFPYMVGSGSTFAKESPGIDVELLSVMAKELNLNVSFERVTWEGCLASLKQGRFDAIFPASYKEKRLQYGSYPRTKQGKLDEKRSLREISYSLYKLKGSPLKWDGNKITDIALPIGTTRGWAIADDLVNMGVEVELNANPKYDLLKVIAGRIDAAAYHTRTIDSLIKENPIKYEKIEKVTPPLKNKKYYLMISHQFQHKYPRLTEKIWNQVNKIYNSDIHFDLLKKYNEL